MKNHQIEGSPGQALLTLLVTTIIAIAVISGAVALTASSTSSTTMVANSEAALSHAQSGIDLAILRLLRDPSYTGEVINIEGTAVTVNVSAQDTVVIESTAKVGNHTKKLRQTGTFSNLTFTPLTWTEIL